MPVKIDWLRLEGMPATGQERKFARGRFAAGYLLVSRGLMRNITAGAVK